MINQELFSYAVMTSIMGMTVVFGFLTFLSIFMVVIKRLFDRNNSKPADTVSSDEKPPAENNSGSGSRAESEDWIIAAVSAFIADEDQPRSAMSWLPSADDKFDPWVSTPRISPRI